MTAERINEINELIKTELKKKEEVLNNISRYQNEAFTIDKNISLLNEEKSKLEKDIEKTKINTFDSFIKYWQKGLDYLKNDLVFFDEKLYLSLENHLSQKPPIEDLENYLEIGRKGADDESSTN